MAERTEERGATSAARTRAYQRRVDVVDGYVPGALGRLLELQETYYLGGWGLDFGLVGWSGTELVRFLERYDEATDRLFLAVEESDDPASVRPTILGAVAIEGDRDDERLAQLRWFITAPEARGHGLGRRLLDAAMAFCEPRFDRVYLTTMQGLDAAIHLYEDYGFELVGERPYRDWGQEITLRRYELSL